MTVEGSRRTLWVGWKMPTSSDVPTLRRWTMVAVLLLVALRLAFAAVVPLAIDESYYWLWSKHLAGGYYDHPPMVAFIIRLGTLIGGDTEFGVRVVSVLLALPASWAVWRTAALLYDETVAAKAVVYFNLTLMVAGGTLIVTPDSPLLLTACFVLYFLARVSVSRNGAWWLAVGAAAGAGLLSKYSMFLAGGAIAVLLIVVSDMRRWLLTPWPYLGGLLALALFTPVIAWNLDHGMVSFIKQFGRADFDGFRPKFVPEMIAVQAGLATPPIFALGVIGLLAPPPTCPEASSARWLAAIMIWPVLGYFLWHALHARVEGNWLAHVYPAFAILAAGAAQMSFRRPWLEHLREASDRLAVPTGLVIFLAVALHAAVMAFPSAHDPVAQKTAVGWRALGRAIDDVRRSQNAAGVLTDNYGTTGLLSFYLPSHPPVIEITERIRWINAPAPDPALFRHPLLLVIAEPAGSPAVRRPPAVATGRFAQVTEIARLPRTVRGVTLDYWRVYLVRDPPGDPIDHSSPPELRRPPPLWTMGFGRRP
jgi:4-amino-4-deoxy-L-arabinose transferase-like glycosyltransferase